MSFRPFKPAIDEHLMRELATASRVKSIEMPLSADARVFIILDGELVEDDFQRLHQVVNQIKEAYFPSPIVEPVVVAAQPAAERPAKQPGQKVLRKLPPCQKHPTSGRSLTSNRCLACEKVKYDKLREVMKERWVKQKAKDQQGQPVN